MKFSYKTVTRKILADLYTPVGVYMRLRDIYPQSALMERYPFIMAVRNSTGYRHLRSAVR